MLFLMIENSLVFSFVCVCCITPGGGGLILAERTLFLIQQLPKVSPGVG